MNAKEYQELLKSLSRRNFLRTGSAAVAATLLAQGATVRAQERSNTENAEHDHSANDPAQENKGLLDLNPDSNLPPPTDHGDIVPLWYSFDLVKKRIQEGGWTHEVTQRELPSSTAIAGVNMRLTAGSYRELHWHTADEWAFVLYGKAQVTVMNPDGLMSINNVEAGDVWLFPAGFPHSIQGLEPDGTEFLLVFNQGMFSEDGTMLLSEFLAHTPPEVLQKNLGVSKDALASLPTGSLYIFPGKVSTNTIAQDYAEIGKDLDPSTQFTFKFRSMPPTKSSKGGEVRILDSHNFPAANKIAAALVTIKPGGMRELHWHPNGSEWQFWIAGQGRMTVFFPVDNARTVDFHANDVGFVPANSGHYIENTGNTDVVFLEMFAADTFMDVSLNQWLRHLPPHIVQEHLGFDSATLARIPADKQGVL
jgi:oxalate decarboxylase